MVKYTSALLVAAVLAGPALANVSWEDLNARDISEPELYDREIEELFIRAPNTVYPDEVQDLAARSLFTSIVTAVFRRGDALLTRDLHELDARDIDELYERYIESRDNEPAQKPFNFFRTFWKAVRLWAHRNDSKSKSKSKPTTPATTPDPAAPAPAPAAAAPPAADPASAGGEAQPATREVADIYERDFDEDLLERDLDTDLEERDFDTALEERDFDTDLEERDFDTDLEERDFDTDLEERDYSDPELYDREYLDEEEEEFMRRAFGEFDDLD